MDKLDTYNRVPSLESQLIRRLIIGSHIILVLCASFGLTSYWLREDAWAYLIPGSLIALAASLMLSNYESHRAKRCRNCHSLLEYAVRPLLLSHQLLAQEGKKVGNFFYTQKKLALWSPRRWVKLSHQSQVCHHCRLMAKYRFLFFW